VGQDGVGLSKDDHTYDLALAIPHEEVEHEGWFSEFLGKGHRDASDVLEPALIGTLPI